MFRENIQFLIIVRIRFKQGQWLERDKIFQQYRTKLIKINTKKRKTPVNLQ